MFDRRTRTWIARSVRVRIAVALVGTMVLTATFAEWLAADYPVFASTTARKSVVLPSVLFHPRRLSGVRPVATAGELFPLVHVSATTQSSHGLGMEPSLRHPFGTDSLGRDIFARAVYGSRVALGIGLLAMTLAAALGIFLGGLAGIAGGAVDEALARPIELVQAFPAIVIVAIVRAMAPQQSFWGLALAVAATRWAEIARMVRSQVLLMRRTPALRAGVALGGSRWHLFRHHILPSLQRPLMVTLLFGAASVILLEEAMNVLGFGLSESWGAMIAAGIHGGSLRAAFVGGISAASLIVGLYLLADLVDEGTEVGLRRSRRKRGRQSMVIPQDGHGSRNL